MTTPTLKKPKMVLFDYGHTLLHELEHDVERGFSALMPYVTANPRQRTPAQLTEARSRLRRELAGTTYDIGRDYRDEDFMRVLLACEEVELSISAEEASALVWYETSPAVPMAHIGELLGALREAGIRTGVVSNLSYSSSALKKRIDRALPDNGFSFVMASCEYLFRKPDPRFFHAALFRAGMDAADTWYCGDNLGADVCGAAGVGMFPIYYDCGLPRWYEMGEPQTVPEVPFLTVTDWSALTARVRAL